ncbi:MAG: ketopantoate reductase C-terminal domain-containing protein [Cloacibacillus evryensis]
MDMLGAEGKTSMLQDIEARRLTEVEAFAGPWSILPTARARCPRQPYLPAADPGDGRIFLNGRRMNGPPGRRRGAEGLRRLPRLHASLKTGSASVRS